MSRFCKPGQLRGLLAATAFLLASSTAQALDDNTFISSTFRHTINAVIAVPSLVIDKMIDTAFNGSTGWHREKFFKLVEASGYELKSADTTIGLIPEIKLAYEQARELSDNDREALEDEIRAFEEEDPTWIEGKLQAHILRFLLAASELGEYRIGEFDISVLPLPGFSFSSMPAEFTYTPDTSLIMRRMTEMEDKMKHDVSNKKSHGDQP